VVGVERHIDIGAIGRVEPRARRLGPLSSWRRRRELGVARRAADAELLASESVSPATAWRAREVTAPDNRREVAQSIRRLVRSADARYLPGPTPLNRLVVREQGAELLALGEWLEDIDRPITARGVLMIDELLTDGYGPLYVPYRAGELRWTLARIATHCQPS
jgi:hypothetical protein